MKRIKSIYRFLVLTGCIVMTSCSNYLDIQPVGKVIPNTLEEYRALMTTAYSKDLLDRSVCDMRTKDITIKKDNIDQSDYGDIEKWINNSTSAREFGWLDYYENIYYANAIIDKQDEITEGSEQDINQLVGEAYLMRGYMHFLLVNFYGQPYTKEGAPKTKSIPLKLTLDLEEIPSRNTVEEVYTSILEDIESARNLITKKEWELGYNYRFNTLSVDAFEARVRLYKGEWQLEYAAAERVLKQKATLEDYNNPDAKANLYTSVESITAYERIYEPTSTLDASKATQSFVDMFSEGDLRPIRYFGEKDNEVDYYPIIKTSGSVDYKCSFRVGELYLNSAEAAARLGHLPEARNRLLQLMEKRYNPEKYELKKNEINNMEQEILISEILDERARELAFEGHRWFDLRRTTRPRIEKTLYSGQTIILEQNDERYTLRIPQSAIEANPNLSN